MSPVLLVLLLISRKRDSTIGIWVCKPILSIAFVLCAAYNAQNWNVFQLLIVCGLFLCLVGDVLLIPKHKKMFTLGLVSFLSGHLFYVGAFLSLANVELMLPENALLLTGITIILVFVFRLLMQWLHEYLQTMQLAVSCYMLVISSMVLAACILALDEQVSLLARVLILGGALAFFVSDLFVVRQRFVFQSFVNPLVGLPLYYVAQFALAISLAYID